jgi:hypothetical protein
VCACRGIDYALSGGDVPEIAAQIPDTMRKVNLIAFIQKNVVAII